ncbi:MAG: serine/threonine protein kinase [Planctomycetes bacterium]|nr:serine/threonine protein kinase [Planctomycetota bacterium]
MTPESGSKPEFTRTAWERAAEVDRERAALAMAEAAIDIDPAARDSWLDSACAGSTDLRDRVRRLLEACEQAERMGDGLVLPPLAPPRLSATLHTPLEGVPTERRGTRFAIGERVGRYRIERFVAAGGMGEVYEARDEGLGRRVAIKVVASTTSAARSKRFEFEAALMARLEHPGIARLYEWAECDRDDRATGYIAMEFVDGVPLTQAAAAMADVGDRAALCLQLCEAVEYAHSRGVIHRDLKPANILVDGSGCVRVLDFGIGSLLDPAQRSNLSRTDGSPRPGTLAYMSPEQLRGGADSISTLSDLYSLGLVLYEVFAGRPAFSFTDTPIDAAIRAVLDNDPPALGSVNTACRGDLEAIVSAAIRKEPAARYQSVAALAQDLARFRRGEAVLVRRPGIGERARRFVRRHRVLSATLAAAAVALAAGLSVAAVQYQRAIDAEREAERRLNEARSLAKTLLFDFSAAVSKLQGSAPLRAMLAERAMAALEPLAAGTADPELLMYLAEGYTRLAMVLGVPGGSHVDQFDRAAETLEAAESLGTRAAGARPNDSRAWMVLGAVHTAKAGAAGPADYSKCLQAATECYRKAFQLRGSRVDTPEGKQAAERVAFLAGHLAAAISETDQQVREFQSSFDLYDNLIEQYPGEKLFVQSRAIVLRSYGSLLCKSRPAEARSSLSRAAEDFEGLLAADPNDYSSVRHLARCRVDLADLLSDEGRHTEAIALMDLAAGLVEERSRGDPTDTLKRDDRFDSEIWRSLPRLRAARSDLLPREQRARWAADSRSRLEAALVEMKEQRADVSPRDGIRRRRLEESLADARAAERELGAPE